MHGVDLNLNIFFCFINFICHVILPPAILVFMHCKVINLPAIFIYRIKKYCTFAIVISFVIKHWIKCWCYCMLPCAAKFAPLYWKLNFGVVLLRFFLAVLEFFMLIFLNCFRLNRMLCPCY